MPRPKRDFAREEAELRAELEGSKIIDLVADGLSQLEEDWARALVKARPASRLSHIAAMRAAAKRGIEPSVALEASKHMAKAAEWRELANTGATSGGEGLGGWYRLLELRLAWAWMLAGAAKDPSIKRQGRELCKELERHRKDLFPERRGDLDVLKRIFK
jgi:hypothetical protein